MAAGKFEFARKMRDEPTPGELAIKTEHERLIGKTKSRVLLQHPLYGYILDFYWPHRTFVLEVDGRQHLDREAYDRKRDQVLRGHGICTMRWPSSVAVTFPRESLDAAMRICRMRHYWTPKCSFGQKGPDGERMVKDLLGIDIDLCGMASRGDWSPLSDLARIFHLHTP